MYSFIFIKKIILSIFIIYFSISSLAKSSFIIRITGDQGSTVEDLNSELSAENKLPQYIELDSDMTEHEINFLYQRLSNLVDEASPGEYMTRYFFYGSSKDNICFLSDSLNFEMELLQIYKKLPGNFISKYFYIFDSSSRSQNHFAIKYSLSTNEPSSTWLNIERCD